MSKISELSVLNNVDIVNDLLPIVDVSDGTTKKISPSNLIPTSNVYSSNGIVMSKTNNLVNITTIGCSVEVLNDAIVSSGCAPLRELRVTAIDGNGRRSVVIRLDGTGVIGVLDVSTWNDVASENLSLIFNCIYATV